MVTFEDGKYTNAMCQCCMSLLSRNVGVSKVGPVISDVLQLCDKVPSKLPSAALLKQMIVEGRGVVCSRVRTDFA